MDRNATPGSFLHTLLHTHPDDSIRRWSSLIGIVTALVGNTLISFALNIQRYAHLRLKRENESVKLYRRKRRQPASLHDTSQPNKSATSDACVNGSNGYAGCVTGDADPGRIGEYPTMTATESSGDREVIEKQYLSSPWWWMGFVMMVLGELGNFLAYGFAPASIVSPLGVVALISNCVIAPVMLKEPFRSRDLFGVIISVCGVVTVVFSSKPEETKLGPDEIILAISQLTFLIYFAITAAVILILSYLSSYEPKYGQSLGQRFILIDLGLVGLYGGYTALVTKGVSSLLTFGSFWLVFTYPISYVLLLVLVTTAILQIKYLNRALERFESTQVIPIQFVSFTLSVIVGSAVLYRDFEHTTLEMMLEFIIGCGLTFSGVYLITSLRPTPPQVLDDSDDCGDTGDLENSSIPVNGPDLMEHWKGRERTLASKADSTRPLDVDDEPINYLTQCAPVGRSNSSLPGRSVGRIRRDIARTGESASNFISEATEITRLLSNQYSDHIASEERSHRSASNGSVESTRTWSVEPFGTSHDHRHPVQNVETAITTKAPHRKSISDLLPGPIVVGLSPLQAVVAASGNSIKRAARRSTQATLIRGKSLGQRRNSSNLPNGNGGQGGDEDEPTTP